MFSPLPAPLSLPFMPREYPFTDDDFRFIADFIYRHTRIVLKEEKKPMVYSRLAKRVRYCKLSDFSSYIAFIQSTSGLAEREEMINAITTNLTSFFREHHHFEHLQKTALPQLVKARSKASGSSNIRIWSAGCSSGQESYSIAMTALDALRNNEAAKIAITATDIDTNMVAAARNGIYHAAGAKEIPQKYHRHFETMGESEIRIKDHVKEHITFTKLNLHDKWPMQDPFDVIFCRNVVIYFDKETQAALFSRFAEMLAPDGWLYIGHSESLALISNRFTLVGRTIYIRSDGPHAGAHL